MHITHVLGHSLPGRWRLAAAALVAAFCITLTLSIGGTAPASAASATSATSATSAASQAYLAPGDSIIFPTWFWGSTTVCADNLGGADGTVTVDPWPWGGSYDTIDVPAYGSGCTSGSWWGNPVQVTNHGSTFMHVRST